MTLLLRRITTAIPALLVLSFTVFVFLEIAPGDIAEIVTAGQINRQAGSDEAIESIREEIGADQPFLVRYTSYLGMLSRGDLGWSVRTQRPVREEIAQRLPVTAALALGGMAVSIFISMTLGISAALQHNRWWDQVVTSIISVNQALPAFWVGLMLVWIFAVQLGWLPAFGTGTFQHWILPCITLGLTLANGLTRITRISIIEAKNSPHLVVAQSKGLRDRGIFWRHLFRVAAIPIVAFLGLQSVFVVGGVVIIEVVFGIPGLGDLVVRSVNDQDPMLLQALTLMIAVMAFVLLALFDLLVVVLDPRIRS